MILAAESIVKQFRQGRTVVSAVDGVSLEVQPGERLALLGRSGAGKSTLFRMFNATLRPTAGTVRVDGRDLADLSGGDLRRVRRRIGTIYQQHNLVPSLSAFENTLCGALGRWSLGQTLRSLVRPSAGDARQALAALDAVDLLHRRGARADSLSGGEQQRVAVARTLMQDAEVILADEPIASLDPALADEVITLLMRVAAASGRTLVMSLHRVELALRHFPRIVALRDGRVDFDLPAGQVDRERLARLYASDDPAPQPPATEPDGLPNLTCIS